MLILLVDDQPDFANTLADNLREGPWKILAAQSGEEALEILERNPEISILATDFNMPPGMDGAQLIRRAIALRPDLYTIVFTGFEDRSYAIRSLRVGANDFLDKVADLDERLRKSFGKAIQRQTIARLRREFLKMDDDKKILQAVFQSLRQVFFSSGSAGGICLATKEWATRKHRIQEVKRLGADEVLGEKGSAAEDSAYSYVLNHGGVYYPTLFGPKDTELSAFHSDTRSMIVVPLTLRSLEKGALGVERPEVDGFEVADLEFLHQIADWISFAMERLTSLDRIELERFKGERDRGLLARSLLHELKTPLNNLSTAVQVVLESVESDELSELDENIIQINQVVDRFLQPLIQHGQEPELVDLPTVLSEAVTRIRVYDPRRTIRVEFNVSSVLPRIMAKRDILVAAFVNLMENATEAAGRGGWIQVSARENASQHQVEILIEDDGVGIAPDELDKVFDYGYTSSGEGHFGYGLALTRDIVLTHSGDISVESTLGEGTRFKLTFPSKDPESQIA